MSNIKIIVNISELLQIKDIGRPRSGALMSELDIAPENSSVVIEGEYIKEILPQNQALKKYKDAEIIDAENNVVMPGLCDSHTHTVFAGSREDEFEMRIKGADYMEILKAGGGIMNTVRATRKISEKDLYEISKKRIEKYLFKYGITSLEIKSGYGLDKETELKQLRVINELKKINPEIKSTFLGAHALNENFSKTSDYIEYLNKEVLPEVAENKLADFCDIFCEKGVFTPEDAEKHLTEAKKYGLIPKMHADELKYSEAAEVAAKVKAISADHLLKASENALKDMKNSGTIATLLPATLYNLASTEYPKARFMIDNIELPVALASDYNPGSSFCPNLFLTAHIACQYMKMTPAEVLVAMTINGAYAMNVNEKTGSIEPGKLADIIILDAPNYKYIPYHFGINPVITTIKRGKIVNL